MKEALNLEDLKPKSAKFSLASTGSTYHLRPMNLEDEIWLRNTFTEDEINSIFREGRFKEICRIAFRLLDGPNRRDFKMKMVEFQSEETGETFEKEIGGVKLFYAAIQGPQEK